MGTKMRWDRAAARSRIQRNGAEQGVELPTAVDVAIAARRAGQELALLDSICHRPTVPVALVVRRKSTGLIVKLEPKGPTKPERGAKLVPVRTPKKLEAPHRPAVPSKPFTKCLKCGASIIWTIEASGGYLAVDARPTRRRGAVAVVFVSGGGFPRSQVQPPGIARRGDLYNQHDTICPRHRTKARKNGGETKKGIAL